MKAENKKFNYSTITMDFLKAEYDQSWSHARHVENQRDKYLGFSFTIILATIGYIITVIKDFNPPDDSYWVIIGIYIFTTIAYLLSSILLIS